MKLKLVTLCILSAVVFFACKKAATPTTYTCTGIAAATYTNDIKPILDASCATSGCHSASKKAAGYDFSTYTGVKEHVGHNAFMGSMQHLSGYNSMPQGSPKLSDSILQKISCWITAGSPQ
jgi:hypothetical protein